MVVKFLENGAFILSLVVFVYVLTDTVLNVKYQNRVLLNILILLLTYDVFVSMAVLNHIYLLFPHLLFTNWPLPFLYGPLLYVFILNDEANVRLKWFHLVYFMPFLFMLFMDVPVIAANAERKLEILRQFIGNGIPYLSNDLEWISHALYSTIFSWLTMDVLRSKRKVEGKKSVRTYYILVSILILHLLQLAYLVLYYFGSGFKQNYLYVTLFWVLTLSLYVVKIFSKKVDKHNYPV